VTGRED